MRGKLAFGAFILVCASVAGAADVWRWVDSSGEVHYSDRWVPGSVLIKVERNRTHPEAADAARNEEENRLAVTNDRVDAEQTRNAESQAVRRDVVETRNEQCKAAKDRYEKAIQARRIFKTGKDGERQYLNDAEADEWRLQARQEMQQACRASSS